MSRSILNLSVSRFLNLVLSSTTTASNDFSAPSFTSQGSPSGLIVQICASLASAASRFLTPPWSTATLRLLNASHLATSAGHTE